MKVAKQSANKSVNAAERRADWWLFGGIYRPVWLEVVPEVSMEHFVIDARADGHFRASVRTSGDSEGYFLSISVQGLKDGKFLKTDEGKEEMTCRISCAGKETNVETWWHDVKVWNTESPELYRVRLILKDREGKIVQEREVRTGFRTIEFFRKTDFI